MNALFYNDDTIHKIYEVKGAFDLEYQLPKIIYSSFISMLLNTILKILSLSNSAILDFKNNKAKKGLKEKTKSLKNKLHIKFILYFINSFLLLIFFWYYISMFCVIYRNTQLHLLKDTLMSFGLSFFDPFFINLIPGIFRIVSLSDPKKNRKYLYNLTKIFNFF